MSDNQPGRSNTTDGQAIFRRGCDFLLGMCACSMIGAAWYLDLVVLGTLPLLAAIAIGWEVAHGR